MDQIRTINQSKSPQMAIDSKEKMGYPTLVSATVICCDIARRSRIRNAKVAGSIPVLGNHSKPSLEQSFDGFSFWFNS